MIDLYDIIKSNGEPKAIIDYSVNQNGKKIIFDFEEIMYLDNNLNLFINNQKIKGNYLEIWQEHISRWKSETKDNDIAALGFFSYDFNICISHFCN